jgi:hypothetical protein
MLVRLDSATEKVQARSMTAKHAIGSFMEESYRVGMTGDKAKGGKVSCPIDLALNTHIQSSGIITLTNTLFQRD